MGTFWARDEGPGAVGESLVLPQDGTDGDVPPALGGESALEYMSDNSSPQMFFHVIAPFLVLPLDPRLASSAGTQTGPSGTAEANSSWANSRWAILIDPEAAAGSHALPGRSLNGDFSILLLCSCGGCGGRRLQPGPSLPPGP